MDDECTVPGPSWSSTYVHWDLSFPEDREPHVKPAVPPRALDKQQVLVYGDSMPKRTRAEHLVPDLTREPRNRRERRAWTAAGWEPKA